MFGLLISGVILAALICTGQVKPRPTFEIRDLVDSSSAVKRVLTDQERKKFFVGDTVFFSRADMESVTADKNPEGGDGSVLDIAWNPESADRWTQYTASRVGRRIAIIVNGKVLATPKILDPIQSPRIMVSLPDIGMEQAKKMAAALSPGKR